MARNGHEALAAADARPPALIVLDIGLPDTDGRDLCQALRSRGVMAPVLFLTARDSVPDRVSGFGVGGDDYLTKPFEFAELVGQAAGPSRGARGSTPRSVPGTCSLDPVKHGAEARRAVRGAHPDRVPVARGARGRGPGETLGRRELVAVAWPPGAIVHDNTLDVYIGRLRRKLAELASETEIRTAHGVGYRLE